MFDVLCQAPIIELNLLASIALVGTLAVSVARAVVLPSVYNPCPDTVFGGAALIGLC